MTSQSSEQYLVKPSADTGSNDLPGRFEQLIPSDSPSGGSAALQLTNTEQIRDYLVSFDSFADSPVEGRDYVNHALKRFLVTVGMVPPAERSRQRLLEIGGHPYYTTLLLHRFRGYQIYTTNFFGQDYPHIGQQRLSSEKYDETYICNFVNVNLEQDSLPYPDDTFDAVLFAEVIEHLTQDPTFALVELHRVLKPGGQLLITTPNIFRLQNVMDMLRGRRNIFHPYSGHGVYGRHQREYGLGELLDLVRGCGYAVLRSEVEDYEPSKWLERTAKRFWRGRRDNLFLLARREGNRRFYYPGWLYIAPLDIRRVVDSDVRMGVNDVGHLRHGWWGVDPIAEGLVRWTTADAQICLVYPKSGTCELVIEANAMGKTLGPVSVTLSVDEQQYTYEMADDGWQQMVAPICEESDPGQVSCRIRVEPTRCPRDLAVNADDRRLGIMVRRIYIR